MRHARPSRPSGAQRTSNSSSRSAALLASGPCAAMIAPGFGSLRHGKCPLFATMPALGLWAKRPQKAAGTRIDPPMSLPSSAPVRPAATAAAPPPVLPPAVSAGFQGFVVRPNSLLTDCQSALATGTLVLPRITAPAARSRRTLGASSAAMASAGSIIPPVDGRPATWMPSLTVIGSPVRLPARALPARRFAAPLRERDRSPESRSR